MLRLSASSASLLGLRRVDAVEANALTANLEGVAVNDADLANDVFGVGAEGEEN